MLSFFKSRPLLTVWLFAIIFHALLFFVLIPSSLFISDSTDGFQYTTLANNILEGHGFSLRIVAPYVPDTIRTPFYPLVLAVFIKLFGNPVTSLPFTMLIGTIIPVAGVYIAKLLGCSVKQQIVVGLILSLDPNLWYYSMIIGSEGIFLPFVAAAIAILMAGMQKQTKSRAALAGLLLGVSCLGRPIVQFVPIVLIGCLIGLGWIVKPRRQLVNFGIIFLVTFVLTVSPWLLRNYRVFNVIDFSNVGWFNMYTRVAATAEALAVGKSYPDMRVEFLQRLHEKGYVKKAPVLEQDVHGYEFKKIFKEETWDVVKKYPKQTLLSQVSAVWTVVSQDITVLIAKNTGLVDVTYPSKSIAEVISQNGIRAALFYVSGFVLTPWLYAIVMRIFWLIIFFFALIAPFFVIREQGSRRVMVYFAWLYMLGIIALSLNAAAQADGRYRSQYIFVEIPLALISISALIERQKEKKAKKILCQACETRFWTRVIGKRKQFSVWKCHSCGSLTVDPMPSEAERKAFYAEAYFSGNAEGGGYASYNADKIATRSTYEKMLDLLEPYRAPGAKMIDIGAASGMFVKWAQERGWDAIGQDISSAAAQMASENGVVVQTIPVEQIPVSTYAAVTALDVIEHVDQPRQFLRSLLNGLVPGGVILINTPDAESVLGRVLRHRWHAVCPPEHVVLFSKKSLIQLVEQEGNDVVWVGRIPKTFRLSYIFSTAARWLNLKAMLRIENWLKKHPKADISLPLPMRDNIALIARRRG